MAATVTRFIMHRGFAPLHSSNRYKRYQNDHDKKNPA